jgi:sulfate permease, SulP family
VQGTARPDPQRPRLRPALLDALRSYDLRTLGGDLQAGLVVGVVAIPLAIAFAIATLGDSAGNAPQVGLVTVVVAGAIAALAGGSRFLVTGPTGAFIVVLAGVVQRHGFDGLLLATGLAGVLLVLAGLFRLGQVIQFIPYPVTVGFTAGIAVVIFAGQLPDLAGVSLSASPPHALEKAWAVAAEVAGGAWNPLALAVALGTIAVIQGFKRWLPRVPGPVVALLLFTAVVQVAHLDVATVGDKYVIPRGLPAPSLPQVSWAAVRDVMPDAVVIALLGAIESLLAAVVADGMMRTRHDSNQELVAQGLANVAVPLFGGIAATGAIARTATSIQNGGRTPVAALVHVAVVVAVLFLLAPSAGLIPMAVLAGILAVVAWNMSKRHHFAKILRMPRTDAGVLLATFLLTVVVDLTVAVTVGLLLAVGIFVHRMSGMTSIGRVDPLADLEPSQYRFAPEDVPDGVVVYSVAGPFFFGAADQFKQTLSTAAKTPKVVILRMRDVPYLDATGLNALESVIHGLRRQGARVMVSAIQSAPLDFLQRAGTMRLLGDENLFHDTPAALIEARRHLGMEPRPAAPAPPG